MRRVYPGFLQLTAFMSMNAERHIKAQMDLYKALAKGETEQASHHQGLLRRIFRRARHDGRVLSRDGAVGVPGTSAGQGRARLEGPAGQSQGDPPHRPVHRRGRARRHLRHRPDRGGARSLLQPAALPQEALYAGRRRPLRRVQRPALGQPDLPLGAEHDPGQRDRRRLWVQIRSTLWRHGRFSEEDPRRLGKARRQGAARQAARRRSTG